MSLIAAERIKLASVRSPWWCAGVGVLLAAGVNGLIAGDIAVRGPLTVGMTQLGTPIGLSVVLVMACLAVTGEYAAGTIRATFLAVPRRTPALLAKAVVLAVVAAAIGVVVAFASWGLAHLLAPATGLALVDEVAWRQVAGVGVAYAVAAVFALAVGILVRHTAGALVVALGWALLAEPLVEQVPGVGPAVAAWLPFHAAKQFLAAMPLPAVLPGGPWAAAAWFVAVTGALLAVALTVARRRDA